MAASSPLLLEQIQSIRFSLQRTNLSFSVWCNFYLKLEIGWFIGTKSTWSLAILIPITSHSCSLFQSWGHLKPLYDHHLLYAFNLFWLMDFFVLLFFVSCCIDKLSITDKEGPDLFFLYDKKMMSVLDFIY